MKTIENFKLRNGLPCFESGSAFPAVNLSPFAEDELLFHAKRLRCYGSLTCSPLNVSLPLLRVHLTTAHTQLSTVIRFWHSRFVPPLPLHPTHTSPLPLGRTLPSHFLVTGWPFLHACRWEKMETCRSSSFLLWLPLPGVVDVPYVFSPQQLFTSLWTGACTVLPIFALLISVLFFFCFFPLSSLAFNSFVLCCIFASSVIHYFCTSDGLSQLQPWLYFWRSVQQLSETLSEGRSQQKACLLINCASPSALLKHTLPKLFPPTFSSCFCLQLCCNICLPCLLWWGWLKVVKIPKMSKLSCQISESSVLIFSLK